MTVGELYEKAKSIDIEDYHVKLTYDNCLMGDIKIIDHNNKHLYVDVWKQLNEEE